MLYAIRCGENIDIITRRNNLKLLLHTCCAPCSIMCIEALRTENIEPELFWYNPNIHPATEYKARKNTLVEYAKSVNAKLIVNNEYGLRRFITEINSDFDGRCKFCYKMRLEETARYAAENSYTHISTTLLISPYQNHALLKATAVEAAEKYGVEFIYRDFRVYFKEGQEKARNLGLYMQKYCGCIFSEEDRYIKKKKSSSSSIQILLP